MVALSRGVFRCVLLTPVGKMLDCRAGSVVMPGYDGHIGILRNHAPMLCRLSRGILQVKEIAGRKNAFFLIEGGFARVSENNVTILTDEVTTFEGLQRSEAEHILSKAKAVVVGGAYIQQQIGEVDVEKARLVVRMSQLSGEF